MEFWNSMLTEKSWKIMQDLKKEKFRFIIIGGWAAYLWTKQHKSKDIDILIPDFNELGLLNKKFVLNKNDRLRKYEIKFEEIDVDIYVPYYSKLSLPVEDIIKKTTKIEGFEVVQPEVLLALKQGAEWDRKDSIKGQKDRIDIITLLCYANPDFKKYQELLFQHKLDSYRQRLKEILVGFTDVQYVGMNIKEYAKIKKELLKKI